MDNAHVSVLIRDTQKLDIKVFFNLYHGLESKRLQYATFVVGAETVVAIFGIREDALTKLIERFNIRCDRSITGEQGEIR